GANIERGLLLKLRFSLDHYANLRPTTLFPGIASPLANPGEVDFVVVREGTEGPYVGNGGAIRQGTPHEVANEVSVNTAFGVERLVRHAFAVASARPRSSRSCTRRTSSCSPVPSGSAPSPRWPPSSPTSPSTTCTSMRPRSS